MEKLNQEFSAIGFFLSGHPLDEYEKVLTKLGVLTYRDFEAGAERGQLAGRIAAIVVAARIKKSAKGNTFAFGMFSDKTGTFEAIIFSDTLDQAGALLEPGTAVILGIAGERDGETLKLRVQGVEALDKAAQSVQRGIRVVFDGRSMQARKTALDELKGLLKAGGRAEVRFAIELEDKSRALDFTLPGRFDVSPSTSGLISTVPGVLAVEDL